MSRKVANRNNGTAYLISLLVMLVLTLMGLALTTLTQTELLIGSNERQIQRLFFAADSGRSASTAKALVANDYFPYEFELEEKQLWSTTAPTTRNSVRMSAFYPAQAEICDLCDSANQYSERDNPLSRIAFTVGSTSTRINDYDGSELGHKTIGTMVDVHPLEETVDALLSVINTADGTVNQDIMADSTVALHGGK